MRNSQKHGYIGFDLLFAFLAISAMLAFSVSALSLKSSQLSAYFSAGNFEYSMLMASDYVAKMGLGGQDAPMQYHHVFQPGSEIQLAAGAKASGLDGFTVYLDSVPYSAGTGACIARIAVVSGMPHKIFVCRDSP